MKVDIVKNISYRKKVQDTNNSNKYSSQVNADYSPSLQLLNYQSVSSKFPLNIPSFGRNFAKTDELNQSYLQQIENAQKEIDALKQEGPNEAVLKAIEENSFYDDFQKNSNSYYDKASRLVEQAENRWRYEHGWWYRVRHQSELFNLIDKEWEYYYAKYRRASEIRPRYESNKELINISNSNVETKEKRIKELESLIENLKKLIDYVGLRRSIDQSLSGYGGLNNRIAGYSFVKNQIRKFIESLSASKDNPDAYVSPCVILYGDTGTGKTTFLKSIEHMASDDVEIIRFDNNDEEPFMDRFRDACIDAQERYKRTKKRTILLMDDAEKYFCMEKAEAEKYYQNELDEVDMEKIDIINRNKTNKDVKEFKAVLDVLSQIPQDDEDKNSNKCAMSIFITTNHPHLIDRQLIKRPEKMDAYHVGPASGEDLNEVVKFYFKDKAKILNDLKMFKDRPDMEAAIDSIPNLDIDAKNSVKEYFRAGKAYMFDIDPSEIDYAQLTEDIQPSLEEGAYSNVMIKRISFNAFERYLQNPEDPYQVYFYDELCNTARDIEPQRYRRYLETSNFVNMYKQSQQIKDIEDRYEFAKLLNKRNKKFISKSDATSLESFLQHMGLRLQALEEKQASGTISENECIELEQLKEQDELSKNPEKLKEYLKSAKQ